MKGLILLLPVVLFFSNSSAQNDTLFFDNDWNLTYDRSNAAFYRAPVKEVDNHWLVRDYFINGTLQYESYYKLIEPKKLLDFENSQEYRDGEVRFYYKSGTLKQLGNTEDGKKVGTWKYYYDTTGNLRSEHKYLNSDNQRREVKVYSEKGTFIREGVLNDKGAQGLWTFYDDSTGKKNAEVEYRNGKIHGELIHYHDNGKVKRREEYFEDMFEEGKVFDENGNEVPYYPNSEPPEPGYNVYAFISKHMKYPKSAEKNNVEETVNVNFAINKKGEVTEIKVINVEANEALQKEAVRVVSLFSKWKPGKREGKLVSWYYTIPITFKLNNDVE